MRLAVMSRGPETADPAGRAPPPIVLLHGLFGRARNLGTVQRRLSMTRRTLAIDLRSHGDSPHGRMDYPTMALDLMETLAGHDALPATLVGHSMGGKVAMTLALTRPEAVASLLVVDIPPAPTAHGSAAIAEALRSVAFPSRLDRAQADALLAPAIREAEIRHLMMQNLRLGDGPGWTIGLEEIVASMRDIEGWPSIAQGARYEGPTLFLAGERSPYIRPEHHAAMRRLFPAHRTLVIEEAGHWLHAERPARFLEVLQAFVALDPEA